MQVGTDLTRRVTLDINEPLPNLASGAAFRLNLMGNLNDVSERDVAENRRFGIAPSLALGLGTPTRWLFSYFHQTADDIPDYGIPWLFNGPAPVNRTNYYGFADGNYLRTYDDIGSAKVEHDFNPNFTIRNQVRYANYVRDVLITEAQVATPVTLATPLSAMTVNRHEIGVNSVESYLDEQLDLTAKVRTGFIRHSFVAGVEAGRETSDPTRPTWTNVPTTSLLNPNPDQALGGHRNDYIARYHHLPHSRRLRTRHHAAGLAVGPDGRDSLGSFRDRLQTNCRSGDGISSRGRDAELARGAGL